ncbi:hypothetical protein KJ762_07250 [bacterium]|nr:hypothetical protein [bacterium]MBU1634291.1 hypothetical protein [bacterium]MBU1875257.1 hypothetical protein [bacterium]
MSILQSKKQVLIICLFILCPLPKSSSFNYNNYQTTFGYWNDNIIYQNFLKNILKVGSDDFVTTCLWSQVAYMHAKRWWIFDLYYNVLTNKSANYRFDLITSRISVEKDMPGALYQIGTGFVFRGNYGGELIQNGYHQLGGYSIIDLPYPEHTAIGWLFLIKAEPYLINNNLQILKLSFCNAYRTAAGPSNFQAGINTSYQFDINNSPISLHAQGRLGYIWYYYLDNLVDPLFDKGLGYTLMITGTYRNRYGISIWRTENQYGQHNPHYGLSFSLKPKGRRLLRISDIMVP